MSLSYAEQLDRSSRRLEAKTRDGLFHHALSTEFNFSHFFSLNQTPNVPNKRRRQLSASFDCQQFIFSLLLREKKNMMKRIYTTIIIGLNHQGKKVKYAVSPKIRNLTWPGILAVMQNTINQYTDLRHFACISKIVKKRLLKTRSAIEQQSINKIKGRSTKGNRIDDRSASPK